MHVVLCGLNELGYRTLEELRRLDEPVVLLARKPAAPDLATAARALGATVVEGNYRDPAVLRSVGVQAASALVVTEDDDVGNLHAALVAQELNPRLGIRLRMFNENLARREWNGCSPTAAPSMPPPSPCPLSWRPRCPTTGVSTWRSTGGSWSSGRRWRAIPSPAPAGPTVRERHRGGLPDRRTRPALHRRRRAVPSAGPDR